MCIRDREKNPSLMMTTAGSSFEGWRVTEYRGTLSTDAVVGAGLPAEADAIVSDLTDQRSLLLGSKMERVKRIAWNELLFRAHEAGANGILAIRYDVYMLPKGLFGASVTGTAVAIEQLSQLNQAPVSYTHLDVYKRQPLMRYFFAIRYTKGRKPTPCTIHFT